MQVMAELSLYALQEDFIAPVDFLLERLNATAGLEVSTNRMSTLVYGDQTLVLTTLDSLLRELRTRFGPVSLVCKLLPGAERTVNGYS